MRVACAFLALLVVGAVAQDYTHIVSGSFTKGDQVKTGGSLARWDTAQKKWFGTSLSTALGLTGVTVVDIEATSSEIIYLLTTDGSSVSRVVQYTPSKENFVVVGEEASGANSFSDIAVIGDRLYVCGGFTFARGRVLGQTPDPRPDVINVGYVAAASDAPRPLWNQIPPSTDVLKATPVCSRLFGFGTRLIMASGGNVWWRSANNDWTSDPTSTDITGSGGSNLRSGGAVPFGNTYVDGATLYMSGSGYTLDPDTTNIYRIVSTTDGVSWAGALRFDETALSADPRRYTASLSNFAVSGGQVYFFASRANGTRTYWAMHRAPVGTQAVGVQTAQTRLGSVFIGDGQNAAANGAPVSNQALSSSGFWFASDKLFFRCAYTVCVNYTEAVYTDLENDDPNNVLYRYATVLGQTVSFSPADNSFATEYAGGLDSAYTKVVKAGGDQLATSFWIIGGGEKGWNKRWLGLAGYNAKTKEWTALGDPLQDWTRFPNAIDGTNNPTGNGLTYSATAPVVVPAINTIHHWGVDNSAVAVIIAGNFRRIYNTTFNGIAWMRSDQPGVWNPIGQGLHENTGSQTFLIKKGGNGGEPVGINTYVKPGVVNAIASTTTGAKGKNGRTLWIGGRFLGSGATRAENVLNNIAKYSFGEENEKVFTALSGGVNGEVFAVDAIGNTVWVGGSFTRAGNATVNNIAMWDDDKKVWSNMQTGVSGTVRQIWADAVNNVWVLSSSAGEHAGGVISTNSNLHRWDGTKWNYITCDSCTTPCELRNPFAGCAATVYEIRRVGSRFFRRTSNALQWNDGSRWRTPSASSYSTFTSQYRDYVSKPISAGDRVLIVGAGVGNGLASEYSQYIAELDLGNDNVYPVAGAGFDNEIYQLSSATSFAPVMTFVALLLAVALLF